MINRYFKRIHETAKRGDAREESYYGDLKTFLDEFAADNGIKNAHVTTLPKRTDAGNPDFRIWDGKQHITGYIEAKDPSVVDMDKMERTDQLQRYIGTFPNLILTNFYEFRHYRDGALSERVVAADPILHKLGSRPVADAEKREALNGLLGKFFSFSLPRVVNARALAMELAKRTRFLRHEVVARELEEATGEEGHSILGFYNAFKKYLIGGLSKEEFADLYSQTVTYGLFAARTRAENEFNRKLAYDNIPRTIGILRDVFRFISLGDVPPQMEWIIDDISGVLAAADVQKILHEYFHEGKGADPIIHFYETFLSEYDPGIRETRGVYYTPEPVVSYIVRLLHEILKREFGRKDGLASENVTVLDPAAGTLTFPAEAAKVAVEEFVAGYGEGAKKDFLKDHILKNFYAFELMMAPYAVGHLKIAFLLEELGCKLNKNERFKLFLTNTLETDELALSEFPIMSSISEESRLAAEVKREQPILVILGNPPYSGHSANASEKYVTEMDALFGEKRKKIKTWIGELIEDYKFVDGVPLGERNPKWLQDDYVKFIRFAQWKIDRAGEGVLGFITNHSYLDNPTFRGMRRSLMKSFNEIFILNLHGNSLKREKNPDKTKDVNVFQIKQGVAIAIFVKKKNRKTSVVYYEDLWGTRERKYEWLAANGLKSTKWKKLSPAADSFLFVPSDVQFQDLYRKFTKISDIFKVNSVGIVTARDKLTIQRTSQDVWTVVNNFAKMPPEIARSAYGLGNDARDWKVSLAQKDLLDSGLKRDNIVPIVYRPFDVRYTYYTGNSRGFLCMPRQEVMRHFLRENIGLLTCRQQSIPGFYHAFVSDSIVESCVVSNKTKEINYIFPLYVYEDVERAKGKPRGMPLMLFESTSDYSVKRPNISSAIMKQLAEIHGKAVTPEDVFHYVYAVLFTPQYRTKYEEFLQRDFPRVPFANSVTVFRKFAALGKKLVELHLMRKEPGASAVKFQGEGDNLVKDLKYDDAQRRVLINKSQYFEGIEPEVWDYTIGGYKVCCKWLKDRKGTRLSMAEIKQYCGIISAMKQTIAIQLKLDAIYPMVEKSRMDPTISASDRF